jgi:hypothetical protein
MPLLDLPPEIAATIIHKLVTLNLRGAWQQRIVRRKFRSLITDDVVSLQPKDTFKYRKDRERILKYQAGGFLTAKLSKPLNYRQDFLNKIIQLAAYLAVSPSVPGSTKVTILSRWRPSYVRVQYRR